MELVCALPKHSFANNAKFSAIYRNTVFHVPILNGSIADTDSEVTTAVVSLPPPQIGQAMKLEPAGPYLSTRSCRPYNFTI